MMRSNQATNSWSTFSCQTGQVQEFEPTPGSTSAVEKKNGEGVRNCCPPKQNTSNGVGSRTRSNGARKRRRSDSRLPLLVQKTLPKYQRRKLGNYLVKSTATALTHPSARCCLLPAKKWSRIKQRNTLLPPNTGSHVKNSATNSFHLHGTNVSTENPRDDPRHTFQAQP